MRFRSFVPVLLILGSAACVDRIFFDLGTAAKLSVTIDGHISNLPGPYTVDLSSEYDIESRYSYRTPVSAKKVIIADDQGNNETLSETSPGVYQTHPSGIRGVIGRAYKVTVELLDGRVYESRPDTLDPAGSLDSLYYELNQLAGNGITTHYGFDVFFDASAGDRNNNRFMWKFTATFQADTHPEQACGDPLSLTDCYPCGDKLCPECNRCNYKPPCSGLRNISRFPRLVDAVFIQVAPCTCCTCWYNIYNPAPILGEGQFTKASSVKKIFAQNIPLNPWIFQHKVHVQVEQMSLSEQTLEYWRAIKSQREAINSLFQPITGKFPPRFTELSGSGSPVSGLFFATSISKKTLFITREDVQPVTLIPESMVPWKDSCITLFPNASTTKPDFWVE